MEQRLGADRGFPNGGGGGSRPGSTHSTPYGSYDQGGGYWPAYSGPHYAVAIMPGAAGTSSHQQEELKHPSSTSRTSRRHAHAPHAPVPQDEAAARHSHSHDPSHPSHHVSLIRNQHRHYAPYAYTTSTDHSLANSPASSRSSEFSDDDGLAGPSTRDKRKSMKKRMSTGRGAGAGLGSPPGHGQGQAIGQLQRALQHGFTPSTSPVLGPLKGLTLMSAQASRAGSRVHSRASSPVHLPPLKLPPSMERTGAQDPSEASGSGSTSGNNRSGAASPDPGRNHEMSASLPRSHHSATPHWQLQHHNKSNRPLGAKSQPGSPTYEERIVETSFGRSIPISSDRRSLSSNGGNLSPPYLGALSSHHPGGTPSYPHIHPRPQHSEHDKHLIRDMLSGTYNAQRTLPPLSSLDSLFNPSSASASSAFFPSAPSSRHNSPPGSPNPNLLSSTASSITGPGNPAGSHRHFGGSTSSHHGSTDSLASLGGTSSVSLSSNGTGGSGGGGLRSAAFSMTRMNPAGQALPSSSDMRQQQQQQSESSLLPPMHFVKSENEDAGHSSASSSLNVRSGNGNLGVGSTTREGRSHSVEVVMKDEEEEEVDQLMEEGEVR